MTKGTALFGLWVLGDLATMIYLTFLDGYVYTWWNWLVAIPVNFLLSSIWPIYWAVLRPLLG